MKITRLTTYIVPPRWCFLKIETDEGITGWGEPVLEGRAHTVATAVDELSDYLIGKDPALIEDHWTVLYRAGFYRGGGVHMSALAGIDQALWDIKGKALGVPVHALLGGQLRDRIRVYSWIGGDRPADTATMARDCGARGFSAVKMNATEEMQFVDSHAKVDAVLARVQAIRDAMGPDFGIGVDFHGRVHRPMAKVIAKELEPFRLMFIEEPVLSEHAEALKEIANHCSTPIALGERLFSRWDFKRILADGYVDIIQPDPVPCGRHHRDEEDRRDGRSVRRRARAPLPAGPDRPRRQPAAGRGVLQRVHPGAVARHPLQHDERPARLPEGPVGVRVPRRLRRHTAGAGLGIEIDEEVVERMSRTGHRWRNPVWRHADGSFAEW